jgi:hypothetical protein
MSSAAPNGWPTTNETNMNTPNFPRTRPMPLYIFDLEIFYKPGGGDKPGAPNGPIIGTLMQLYAVGSDIMIFSGRREDTRVEAIEWLSEHMHIRVHILNEMLFMRPVENRAPDEQLKRKWLNLMDTDKRERLAIVFEHTDKRSVNMWREAGVVCLSEV